MQIKRFEASNMTEALRLIKKEFGPDAVILSARNLNSEKTVFGIKKTAGVEVTAASDTKSIPSGESSNVDTAAVNASNTQKGQKVSVLIDDSVQKKSLIETIQNAFSLRKNSNQITSRRDNNALEMLKSHLLLQGVEEFFILELLEIFTNEFDSEMTWGSQAFNSHLIKTFSEMGIQAGTEIKSSNKPQIHGLVGPAGAGKTSTMARLSAIYTHQLKQKVGWISLDTKRIAATAQLQVYSRIFGIPFAVASDVKDFKMALKRFEEMDHIFIDTPSIGSDSQTVNEISEIFKHASLSMVYLVMSASTKNEDLIRIVKACKPISVNSLIFSKLDESFAYGNVFNLLIRSKLPVSYFTSGQAIPHSIEKASIGKIFDLMLHPDKESEPRDVPPGKNAQIIPYTSNKNTQPPLLQNYYVAKNKSAHFHHPECAWAKRIKPEDRIVFENIEEAAINRYTPCKTCSSRILEHQLSQQVELHRVGNGQL